jgi:hypothetical protein
MATNTNTKTKTINNDKLLKLGERFLNDYEKQKIRSLNYYNKMKNDPDFLQKRREQKQLYYQNNKDKINQHKYDRYKNDEQYKEKKREADRRYYNNITAFNVKNKRGRKPKFNQDETTELNEKPRRGRGRPKKSSYND